MARPTREFSADVGQKSMGIAGPDYIERDFDKLFAMLDPNKNLPTGEQGGIGSENMKPGAADDTVIGDREIDDTQESTGNIGKLSDLLNWLANMIKSITGKSSWRVKPATTLEAVKAHMDAPAPHSEHETKTGAQAKVNAHANLKNNPHNVTAAQTGALVSVDGVSNPGGNVDFVAGTGMVITPDATGKKITFAAKNESIIPGPHAETHSSIGSDPITPESIGAETPAGVQAKLAENIRNQKTTYESFKLGIPKEHICYFDNYTSGSERLQVLYSDKNTIKLQKISNLNPAYISFTPEFPSLTSNLVSYGFEVECSDWSKVEAIVVKLYPTSGTDHYLKYLPLDKAHPKNKPRKYFIDFAKSGTPLETGIMTDGKIQFEISCSEGVEFTFYNGISKLKKNNLVVLQFDDGKKSVYDLAFPVLKERGIPATFNVLTDYISNPSTPDYCSWDNLHELQNSGWTIANHTSNHTNLMSAPITEAISAVLNGKNALIEHGFTGHSVLAPPFNALDSTRDGYMLPMARSIKLGGSYQNLYKDVIHPNNYIRNISASVLNTETVSELLETYDTRLDSTMFMSYCFHSLTTSTDPNSDPYVYNLDKFIDFIDGLIDRGANFVTIEQLADMCLN